MASISYLPVLESRVLYSRDTFDTKELNGIFVLWEYPPRHKLTVHLNLPDPKERVFW